MGKKDWRLGDDVGQRLAGLLARLAGASSMRVYMLW